MTKRFEDIAAMQVGDVFYECESAAPPLPEPVAVCFACKGKGTLDGIGTCERCGGSGKEPVAGAPDLEPEAWLDPTTAPKDGTMLQLLIQRGDVDRGAWSPFEDSLDPYVTIGFNNLANTQEDEWEFVGWDWSHDCFTTGYGEVVGWLPFGPDALATLSANLDAMRRERDDAVAKHYKDETAMELIATAARLVKEAGYDNPQQIVARAETAEAEVARLTARVGELEKGLEPTVERAYREGYADGWAAHDRDDHDPDGDWLACDSRRALLPAKKEDRTNDA